MVTNYDGGGNDERQSVGLGFAGSGVSKKTVWDPYIGRPVSFQIVGGGSSIGGVFESFDYALGCADLRPSLVPSGDYMRLEEEVPTRVIVGSGVPIVIRPLEEGDLLKIMKEHNEGIDRERDREDGDDE